MSGSYEMVSERCQMLSERCQMASGRQGWFLVKILSTKLPCNGQEGVKCCQEGVRKV